MRIAGIDALWLVGELDISDNRLLYDTTGLEHIQALSRLVMPGPIESGAPIDVKADAIARHAFHVPSWSCNCLQ